MNPTETTLESALVLLAGDFTTFARPEPNRVDVNLAPGGLLPAVSKLHSARWGYLAAITGLDHGAPSGELEVLYHFCAAAAILTLRVRLPRAEAAVPSLCAVIASAGPLERELSEMFGINLVGAANTDPLFLPDNWPVGLYPLRKVAALSGPAVDTGAAC